MLRCFFFWVADGNRQEGDNKPYTTYDGNQKSSYHSPVRRLVVGIPGGWEWDFWLPSTGSHLMDRFDEALLIGSFQLHVGPSPEALPKS